MGEKVNINLKDGSFIKEVTNDGNDYFYLKPPDNEDAAVYRCEYCDVPIYEGEKYFEIEGDTLCEHCVRFLYSKFAQNPRSSEDNYWRWKT